PAAPAEYWDQTTLFGASGQEFRLTLGVPNPALPVKVTLVWSDAAGAVGANPALVNNLDLTVVNGASTYLGNRFSAGWSIAGGAPDVLNNVENVYLQSTGGSIEIIVAATAINGDGVPYNADGTDQDFALVCSNCSLEPDFTLNVAPARLDVCAPANPAYTVTVGQILGFTEPVTLSASGYPPGSTINFSTNPVTPPGTSTLTISNTGSAAGSYTVQVNAASSTGTKSRTAGLGLFTAAPAAVTLLTPANGAANQPVKPTLTWQAAGAGGTYTIEVASDAGFTSIVETASGLTGTSYTLANMLNTSAIYYWRVKAANACGVGSYSAVRSFSTLAAPGDCAVGAPASQLLATGFEAGAPGWTHSGLGDSWTLSGARTHSGAASFHAANPSVISDQSLVMPAVTLPVGSTSLSLKFWNYQSIESQFGGGCWDGGVLEISTNNGVSWTRIESQLLTDPYDGPVSTCCGNPVGGTNAWCGDPQDWKLSVVDLSGFAGQTVRLRFRLGTDDIISREGWYIDDVTVQSCGSPIFNDSFENGDLSVWTFVLP
ncbi:MAG TPA: choice-of-anchor J domain-containing protein, partial [Thermoanaerobaculia bacterium]|nr:choice-of-anchor J domain-containing protein [Thermoanaerobaculia bacterium]